MQRKCIVDGCNRDALVGDVTCWLHLLEDLEDTESTKTDGFLVMPAAEFDDAARARHLVEVARYTVSGRVYVCAALDD
jgi:hypothetical protein